MTCLKNEKKDIIEYLILDKNINYNSEIKNSVTAIKEKNEQLIMIAYLEKLLLLKDCNDKLNKELDSLYIGKEIQI